MGLFQLKLTYEHTWGTMRPKNTLFLIWYLPLLTKLQPSMSLCFNNKVPPGQTLFSKQEDFKREIGKVSLSQMKRPYWRAMCSSVLGSVSSCPLCWPRVLVQCQAHSQTGSVIVGWGKPKFVSWAVIPLLGICPNQVIQTRWTIFAWRCQLLHYFMCKMENSRQRFRKLWNILLRK